MNVNRMLVIAALIVLGLFGQRSVMGQTKEKHIDVVSFSYTVTNTSYMGESVCVSKTTGCRNETWVIRFEPVAGKDDRVRLFADRLEKGKRLPMFVEQVPFNQRWEG